MTLEQAIAALEDPNVHEMIFEPGQLIGWLTELRQHRDINTANAVLDDFREGFYQTINYRITKLEKKLKRMKSDLDSKNAELKEAKRLLKLAVEDLSKMPCNNDTHSPDSCYICVKHGNCSYTDGFKWCRADIALKLIGEQNDESN